jgi:type II secretory pathway pseudopilin PulG
MNATTRNTPRRRQLTAAPGGRAAFTLIEVLLALGLTMLVVAAAYAGLILFQQVTFAGRADAERAQLVRAIERRMAADLRSVAFQPIELTTEPETTGTAGGQVTLNSGLGAADDPGTASGAGTTTLLEPELLDPAEEYPTMSLGVFGDATTLVLHVHKPPRETFVPPQSSGAVAGAALALPPTSELRSISYFVSLEGGTAVAGLPGGPLAAVDPLTGQPASRGLVRVDGDRIAMLQSEFMSFSAEPVGQQAVLLAPEVTEIAFRYFDGAAWYEEWDSYMMNALPRAIEVHLRIEIPLDRDGQIPTLNRTQPPSKSFVHRFVIALPLSDPTLGFAL